MSDSTENAPAKVCVLTAPGRGAIAVVALRGPSATEILANHFLAANGRSLVDQSLSRVVYGRWESAAGEDVVVCRRAVDEVEIHCHGGSQSAERILTVLASSGARAVDWQEWLVRRSNTQLEAEAQVALAAATTTRTAKILLDQYHGALRRDLEAIGALLELKDLTAAGRRIKELLSRAELGLHLTQPWRVVIVGRPNVGKSTLINALAGYQRAIEFDEPGTTRDVVTVVTALAGWPVELSDTAGLHATSDEIERAGIALAREQVRQADLVLWLLDATDKELAKTTSAEDLAAKQAEMAEVPWESSKTLIAVNKCDLPSPSAKLSGIFLRISAASGMGKEELIDGLVQRLVPQSPDAGEAVPFTQRQIEALRESLLHCRSSNASAALEVVCQLLASSSAGAE